MRLNTLIATLLCTCTALLPAGTLAGPSTADDEIIARGEYLARAGNCMGCHTARGGEDFAGGRRLTTDFGIFYTPNITPDPDTGIGDWTREQFRQAMHRGQRADGSPLYPVCPYTSFTRVSREDVDAIHAYLHALPAVRHETPEHDVGFPVSVRALQSLWQRLYFEPGPFEADPDQSERWNRGAYLVRGLGHCMVCHAERGRLGVQREGTGFAGGHVQGWYAPSLHSSDEAGLQGWDEEKAVALLRHGRAGDTSMMGPMADVVYDSLQHLTEDDIRAMTEYLRSLPDEEVNASSRRPPVSARREEIMMGRGREIYENRCMDCHGASGEGTVAAAALAGNRAVTLNDPTNVIQVIRHGGYPPGTEGNPRPFGMPPFAELSAADIAAVATYIRRSWGNEGEPVSSVTVQRTQ